MVLSLIICLLLLICALMQAYMMITDIVRGRNYLKKKKNDNMKIDLCIPECSQYENEAKVAFVKYNVSISSEDEKSAKTIERSLLIGIMLGLKWADEKQEKEE